MKAAEARAAWAELTDAQRVALRSIALLDFDPSLRPACNEIFGTSRGQKALATRTLRALVALGLLKCWEGCQTVYAVTDAARELVRAAADAEKQTRNAERSRKSAKTRRRNDEDAHLVRLGLTPPARTKT